MADTPDQAVDTGNMLQQERTSLTHERNRLANVRTYLAWIRTGLACVGGGIAIIKWLTFTHIEHQKIALVTGGVLVFVGISIFMMSLVEFWRGHFELPATHQYYSNVTYVTALSVILSVASLVLLILSII